jgi:pyruvate formate lyase activating enzyme
MKCDLCPHECDLSDSAVGFCGARANIGGKIACLNYGRVTSLALDPIEKKPLAMYKSGSKILSVGSFGCNFRCPFCQNHGISMLRAKTLGGAEGIARAVSCEELVAKAAELVPAKNIGIAFTYNEPLVGFEFVFDTARLAKERGLDTVVVTNGCVSSGYFEKLLPFVDAANIDLKAFGESFYARVKGSFETVKANIALAAKRCHLELTCLVIPGENDSENEMSAMSAFIASLSAEIPLHITRFFPCHEYADRKPTPLETLFSLKRVAEKKLKNVFVGNV